MGEIVRQRHPATLSVITPYTGFEDSSCSVEHEWKTLSWPLPAFVAVGGTELDKMFPESGCVVNNASQFEDMTAAERTKVRAEMESQTAVLAGNALLCFGAARALTKSPLSPDLYPDPELSQENERRASLSGDSPLGTPLTLGPSSKTIPCPYDLSVSMAELLVCLPNSQQLHSKPKWAPKSS